MEEKQLNESESFELINRMIHEGKNYFNESGINSLIGGFSILICSLLAFAIDKGWSFPFNPFYLLIPAFLVQTFFWRKGEQQKKAKTFTDEAIDHIWAGFYLSVFVVIIAGSFSGIGYIIVSICLFLSALAAFCTGMIAKFRYHIFTSVVCWCLAAASFFLLNEYSYLLLAAAAILTWIIPGFMMNAYLKKMHYGK